MNPQKSQDRGEDNQNAPQKIDDLIQRLGDVGVLLLVQHYFLPGQWTTITQTKLATTARLSNQQTTVFISFPRAA
jgi:hypothetical protein